MTNNKIGIFGGTFNPIHNGHLFIANDFISKFSLDLLYVIPNNISPMKENYGASGDDRLNMLNIAFSGNDKVKVSRIELDREGMSYTRDTVAEIKRLHPNCELYLLIGDDWVDSFDKWKDYRFILDNANLVVAIRNENEPECAVKRLEKRLGKEVFLLRNERFDFSSTEFRNQSKRELLPNGVFEYIEERRLYRK